MMVCRNCSRLCKLRQYFNIKGQQVQELIVFYVAGCGTDAERV